MNYTCNYCQGDLKISDKGQTIELYSCYEHECVVTYYTFSDNLRLYAMTVDITPEVSFHVDPLLNSFPYLRLCKKGEKTGTIINMEPNLLSLNLTGIIYKCKKLVNLKAFL
jgi:hypothetical protein